MANWVRMNGKSTSRNHSDLGRMQSFELVKFRRRVTSPEMCCPHTQLCCCGTHVDSSNTRKSACWRGTPERAAGRPLCISSLSVYSMRDRPLHAPPTPTSLLAELWVNVYIRGTGLNNRGGAAAPGAPDPGTCAK